MEGHAKGILSNALTGNFEEDIASFFLGKRVCSSRMKKMNLSMAVLLLSRYAALCRAHSDMSRYVALSVALCFIMCVCPSVCLYICMPLSRSVSRACALSLFLFFLFGEAGVFEQDTPLDGGTSSPVCLALFLS